MIIRAIAIPMNSGNFLEILVQNMIKDAIEENTNDESRIAILPIFSTTV